jgi:hypothetical protein
VLPQVLGIRGPLQLLLALRYVGRLAALQQLRIGTWGRFDESVSAGVYGQNFIEVKQKYKNGHATSIRLAFLIMGAVDTEKIGKKVKNGAFGALKSKNFVLNYQIHILYF